MWSKPKLHMENFYDRTGSAVDHKSVAPRFKPWLTYVRRVFHLLLFPIISAWWPTNPFSLSHEQKCLWNENNYINYHLNDTSRVILYFLYLFLQNLLKWINLPFLKAPSNHRYADSRNIYATYQAVTFGNGHIVTFDGSYYRMPGELKGLVCHYNITAMVLSLYCSVLMRNTFVALC